MNELERRLDRLESRHALADLAASYCSSIDSKDIDAVVGLFVPDAQFNDLHGSAAIAQFFTNWMAEFGVSFHTLHSQVMKFNSADVATGTVTGHAEQRRRHEVWVMGLQYTDLYRRVEDRWYFARRSVTYRYRVQAQQYKSTFGEVHF